MKILLAGEGGQGIQLAAEVLAHAAFLEGKSASLIPNFGVEQRGGISLAFIIVDEEASYPKFDQAEILAIFCDRARERVARYIGPKTKIIYGPAVAKSDKVGLAVADKGLPAKFWNMVIIGKIIDLTGVVKKESVKRCLEESLGAKFKKNPQLKQMNFQALD